MKNTVAIIGSHPATRGDFDWERTDADVWGFNEALSADWFERADGIFQMHKPVIWRSKTNRNDPERELFGLHIMCDTDMYIDQISNVGYEKKPITIFNETLLNVMGKDKAPVLIKVNKKPLDNAKQYRGSINSAILDYLRIVTDPKTGKKRSKLYIGKDCPWLIRSFAELIHPETMANGLDYDNKHPMRHQFDAFKYWFQALYTPAPVKILTAKEKLAAQQRVGELATAQYEQDYDPRSDW